MANALYPKFKENVMKKLIDLTTDTVKAVLVDTGVYTYSATHANVGSLAGATVGTAQTIGTISVTDGIVDGADVTYTAVTGNSVEAIVIYVDSGVEATSYLVAYIDTVISGLPVTPNGGDITITWGTNIFAL